MSSPRNDNNDYTEKGPPPTAGDAARPEQFMENAGPDHLYSAVMEASINPLRGEKSAAGARLDLMDDEAPINPSSFEEDGTLAKRKILSDHSDGMVEQVEDIVDVELGAVDINMSDLQSGQRTNPSVNGPVDTDDYVEEIEQYVQAVDQTEVNTLDDVDDGTTWNSNLSVRPVVSNGARDEESQNATDVIDATATIETGPTDVVAYPVEDELVQAEVAEPPVPWWKQKRTKCFLCTTVAIVSAFAIVLGVAPLSRDQGNVERSILTPLPTTNFPSASPSLSFAPSSSPTSCAEAIVSNAKMVDFRIEAPRDPSMAVDGNNLVTVVRDFKSSTFYTIFYSLASNGEWIMKNSFHQEQDGVGLSTVAISGKTAFVAAGGLSGSTVSVYDQNDFDFWEKVEDPLLNTNWYSFGWWVDVGPTLACVGDFLGGIIYLFRREKESDKWVQLEWVVGVGCSVADNTVAVAGYKDKEHALYINQTELIDNAGDDWSLDLYTYDEDLDMFLLLQDPIIAFANGGVISQNHAAYSDLVKQDVFLYQRVESNQTYEYTFQQQLNVSPSQDIFALNTLALDKNILVVHEVNHTRIFLEQNATWKEVITLDEPFDSVQLSGYNLLATKGPELYSLDIEGCVPTAAQVSSVSDNVGTVFTTCYQVDISIAFDEWPYNQETSWDLQRMGNSGDKFEVKSYSANFGDISHTESMHKESLCLREGEYEFTIYDSGNNGMGEGYYIVTTSNGTLIAEGGEFGREETTTFSIPLVPVPPEVEIISKAPSPLVTELFPTARPLDSRAPSRSPSTSSASNGFTLEPQQNLSALNEILSATPIQLPDYIVTPEVSPVPGMNIAITQAKCHDLVVQDIQIADTFLSQEQQRIEVVLSEVPCNFQWEASLLGVNGVARTMLEPRSFIEMDVDISEQLDDQQLQDVDIAKCSPNLQVDGQVEINNPNSFIVGIFDSYEEQFRNEVENEVAAELGKHICDLFLGLGDSFDDILVSVFDEVGSLFT